MNKPIIIDGVDVSGCEDLTHQLCCEQYLCEECEGQDCYYKQLQRIKAENDGLKSQLDFEIQKRETIEAENERLKAEVKRLKEPTMIIPKVKQSAVPIDEYKKLQAENEKLKKEVSDLKFYINSYKIIWEIDKKEQYKKALEEVRESIKNMCEENCPDLKNGYCIGINECAERSQKHITRLINEVLKDENI